MYVLYTAVSGPFRFLIVFWVHLCFNLLCTKGCVVEKYIVEENKTKITDDVRLRPLFQDFIVRRPDGVRCERSVQNMLSLFKAGDVIKVYKDKDGLEMACSYKLGGRFYVDIKQQPIHVLYSGVFFDRRGTNDFFRKLSFMDGVRLNNDIVCVLMRRGVMPSLLWTTNLRLLLHDLWYGR